MINIDGKHYRIDLDALMEWVSKSPDTEKNIQTTTTLSYPIYVDEEENEDLTKEITEIKSTLNDTLNQVRYDLVRTLVNNILIYDADPSSSTSSLDDMSLGQKISFNSLLAKKIIVEK